MKLTMSSPTSQALCRDCQHRFSPTVKRCPKCGSKRQLNHPELDNLAIAHIDCDAFYAAIEKRDNPDLEAHPVIIGGGKRGVVSTCCYNARMYGVHSAMPMFKALKACPDAVIVKPNMAKYQEVGYQIRAMMQDLTPDVEPLSIDEAFLNLKGTEALHKSTPAETLTRFARKIEEEIGITVSVGLSHNKFLAKIASDLKKPQGFSVIGEAETLDFLATLPISKIWGIGGKTASKLAKIGLTTIKQLQAMEQADLIKAHGTLGNRLYFLSRGIDRRVVSNVSERKSLSKETTFEKDIYDHDALESYIWRLSNDVSNSLKNKGIMGSTVTLKLKTSHHRSITRQTHLASPTNMMHIIFNAAQMLLSKTQSGVSYRLIGVGVSELKSGDDSPAIDIADPRLNKKNAAEKALDKLHKKFGDKIIGTGRDLK